MPQHNERQWRLHVISEIGDAGPRLPSTRNMAVLLRERGIRVSHVTIAKDYKELDRPHSALADKGGSG